MGFLFLFMRKYFIIIAVVVAAGVAASFFLIPSEEEIVVMKQRDDVQRSSGYVDYKAEFAKGVRSGPVLIGVTTDLSK